MSNKNKKIGKDRMLYFVYIAYMSFVAFISQGNPWFVIPSFIFVAIMFINYNSKSKIREKIIFAYNLVLMGIIGIVYTNAFVVLMGIIISIIGHELGHLYFMKKYGVEVLEYSIGFGPKVKKLFTKDGTDYNLRAFLLGGFVKPVDDDKKKFNNYIKESNKQNKLAITKNFKEKLLIFSGGVMVNLVILICLTLFSISVFGFNVSVLEQEQIDNANPIIANMRETGNHFAGKQILNTKEFKEIENKNKYKIEALEYGVYNIKIPIAEAPYAGYDYLRSNIIIHAKLFTSLTQLKENAGSVVKVGEVVEGKEAKKIITFGQLLNIIGLINLSLIIVNLIPLPALDGGHILKEIIYHIKRLTLRQKDVLENRVNFYEKFVYLEYTFFVLLNLLGVFLILKDTVL